MLRSWNSEQINGTKWHLNQSLVTSLTGKTAELDDASLFADLMVRMMVPEVQLAFPFLLCMNDRLPYISTIFLVTWGISNWYIISQLVFLKVSQGLLPNH